MAIEGDLCVPAEACAIVLFAHGSGSNRKSDRHQTVADALHQKGLATLRVDLLTSTEQKRDKAERDSLLEADGKTVFRNLRHDIGEHVDRFFAVAQWLGKHGPTKASPIGYFGASTGAGVALAAAAKLPAIVGAIVSRGGRPDLTLSFPDLFVRPPLLPPVLLIVGGNDGPVCGLNHKMLEHLHARNKKLVTIPGAGHLFAG